MPAAWVEASRAPKLPGTNAHASCLTPLVFFLVHISWTTLAIVILTVVFVVILSIKGRSVSWLLRKIKCNLRGRKLYARPVWFRRRMLRVASHSDLDIDIFRGG